MRKADRVGIVDLLNCDCKCGNCAEVPHYSSYHCHDIEEFDLEYGALESKGFCIKTGFMPKHSWRLKFDKETGELFPENRDYEYFIGHHFT